MRDETSHNQRLNALEYVYLASSMCPLKNIKYPHEIEGKKVYLQNKTISKNHINWDPNYVYSAWYKAEKEIHIGYEVTPKTNKGDYIIESSGDITVYAGEKVVMKPGFHAQAGSRFHAYIEQDCYLFNPQNQVMDTNQKGYKQGNKAFFNETVNVEELKNEEMTVKVFPNPNTGSFTLELHNANPEGMVYVYGMEGKLHLKEHINSLKTQFHLPLEKGVYVVVYKGNKNTSSIKMIIQ